jgi:hypothetical protein
VQPLGVEQHEEEQRPERAAGAQLVDIDQRDGHERRDLGVVDEEDQVADDARRMEEPVAGHPHCDRVGGQPVEMDELEPEEARREGEVQQVVALVPAPEPVPHAACDRRLHVAARAERSLSAAHALHAARPLRAPLHAARPLRAPLRAAGSVRACFRHAAIVALIWNWTK